MLRYISAIAIGLTSIGLVSYAAEKEMTITGTITCAKCDLGIAKACATVIKDGDKVYFLDAASGKKNHGKVCQAPAQGSVTGVVSKEGDKTIITASKVEFKK